MDYRKASAAKLKLGREPIPQWPVGYFAVAETPAEYVLANRLSALSPSKPECPAG
jgi:hypothetical protein